MANKVASTLKPQVGLVWGLWASPITYTRDGQQILDF